MEIENITHNIEHYDTIYSRVNIDDIIRKVRNLESFLDDATKTDTSWHGLYQGDFSNRLKGKKVLELGCGDGLNALIMTALGANVIAYDISSESKILIHESACALQFKNIQAISGNFADLPLENQSFDFIVGKAFLHHLTHEMEKYYLNKVSNLLKPNGEARFLEPAVNSQTLDTLRWTIPVPGRPSILNRNAFANYKKQDPHPDRDNSTEHFIQVGKQFFVDIKIIHIGSIERFCRLLPQGQLNRRFRRLAHRIETKLPKWFRYKFARSQLIVYAHPRI